MPSPGVQVSVVTLADSYLDVLRQSCDWTNEECAAREEDLWSALQFLAQSPERDVRTWLKQQVPLSSRHWPPLLRERVLSLPLLGAWALANVWVLCDPSVQVRYWRAIVEACIAEEKASGDVLYHSYLVTTRELCAIFTYVQYRQWFISGDIRVSHEDRQWFLREAWNLYVRSFKKTGDVPDIVGLLKDPLLPDDIILEALVLYVGGNDRCVNVWLNPRLPVEYLGEIPRNDDMAVRQILWNTDRPEVLAFLWTHGFIKPGSLHRFLNNECVPADILLQVYKTHTLGPSDVAMIQSRLPSPYREAATRRGIEQYLVGAP